MAMLSPTNNLGDKYINEVYSNTKTDFIEITEDKLENILIKFIRDYKSVSGWITPFSIFLTLLITILSTEFKDFLSIPKEVWTAFFYIILIISFLWFVFSCIGAFQKKEKIKIEYLIKKIKNN